MKKLDRYLSIFALVVVAGTPLLNKPVTATEAALSAPASYNLNYQYDSSNGTFLLGTNALNTYPNGRITYDRTVDSSYYNYSRLVDNSLESIVPLGLSITMTFNRSNTSWAGGFAGSRYLPTDTKIGSNNTVGSIANKVYLQFDNQTNKDYKLFFDQSSKGSEGYFTYEIDDERYYGDSVGSGTILMSHTVLNRWYLPAYSKVEIYVNASSSAYYFDAWYLQDLGESSAFQEGIDAGYDDAYEDGYNNSVSPLWDGLEVVVGVTLNFILFIATLSIFDISLLNIGIVLVSILGLVWVLKALRG
jgi:hypothetical protein